MLRKVSAAEPVWGVIGTICVQSGEIAPEDPPPEALEVDVPVNIPRPPVVVQEGEFIDAVVENSPQCPTPVRKSWLNPLTATIEYYYVYPTAPGTQVVQIPPECGTGFGLLN